MVRNDRSAQDRLHRHWDTVAQGAPGQDATEPALAEVVRRLHALDDAPGPDAGFVRRLRGDLLGSGQMGADSRTAAWPPAAQMAPPPSGAHGGHWTAPVQHAGPARRFWSALATGATRIAAAAVLVVFIGALVLFFRGTAAHQGVLGTPASFPAGLNPTPAGTITTPPVAPALATPSQCAPFRSEGLGLTREQWEARVGRPITTTHEGRAGGPGSQAPDIVTASYPAPRGIYEVRFADGILIGIRYRLDKGVTLSLDETGALIKPLLPADAEFVNRSERGATLQEGYGSVSLAFELGRLAGSRVESCALPEGIEHGVPIIVNYALQDGGLVYDTIDFGFFVGG